MSVENENQLVLVSEEKKKWHDRGQYAEILRELIQSQQALYKKVKDNMKKNKISHSIAYLIQVQNSLINSEKNIEARIEKLEELTKLR